MIHLVRHGRTAWNLQKRVMGWLDEGIEPTSLRDAEAVARVLSIDDVGVIVASPLRRALETAAPLAELAGLTPRVDDRFGEMHVGPWEGLFEDDVADRWPVEWLRWRIEPHLVQMHGRETLSDLNARVAEALDEMAAESAVPGVAVVFTHDAVVRACGGRKFGRGL